MSGKQDDDFVTVKELKHEMKALQRAIQTTSEAIVKHKLEVLNEDKKFVHDAFKMLITKITVSTEVVNVLMRNNDDDVGMISHIIIRAYDRPDSFWQKLDGLSINNAIG